jgi:hypothetical protein
MRCGVDELHDRALAKGMRDLLGAPPQAVRPGLAKVGNPLILLKNSLSAMFDFLGGLWARHSRNQLGDQPIC